jgi:hypothetical protein
VDWRAPETVQAHTAALHQMHHAVAQLGQQYLLLLLLLLHSC